MADDAATWALIHAERTSMAATLADLTPEQWEQRSLCGEWSVRQAAGHIVAGVEQTPGNFVRGMIAHGFRFNTFMDSAARSAGAQSPSELVSRLAARTATTNRPPAPVLAMLGEVVVHGEDIRRPLGISGTVSEAATLACLRMYTHATFPVGGKKRIQGLRLVATDLEWSHGAGPEVAGTAMALMMGMTGRPVPAAELSGAGATTFLDRIGR